MKNTDEQGQGQTAAVLTGAACSYWIERENHPHPGQTVDHFGEQRHLCPKCSSVLFETPPEIWERTIKELADVDPEYPDAIAWGKGQCFGPLPDLLLAYLRDKLRKEKADDQPR